MSKRTVRGLASAIILGSNQLEFHPEVHHRTVPAERAELGAGRCQ
jgi:hypothetical protein